MSEFIPVNVPRLDGKERDYLSECISSGWISSEGPFVSRFEQAFAKRLGRRYAAAVCNGTAALEVAVAALDLRPGDEVIVPSFTIISCAAAVLRAGAVPVLVDSDPETWNMVPGQIKQRITARTRAIMVVHIFGLPVDMAPVLEIAQTHGLFVIEDAAEAIGQTYMGKPCGSFGDVSTLSFYPNKHVTTGEGGMVLVDSERLAERARSLRNLCFNRDRRFVHEELGWNFRMSNLQAAVGLAQLERLDEHVQRKRQIGRQYNRMLANVERLQLPLPATEFAENLYWVYGVVLEESVPFDAEEAMQRLRLRGIGTRPFFWPMHEQPVFKRKGLFANVECPVASRLARRGFYLPSGIGLRDSEISRVAEEVQSLLQ